MSIPTQRTHGKRSALVWAVLAAAALASQSCSGGRDSGARTVTLPPTAVSFENSGQTFAVGSGNGIAAADLDGDGDRDVAMSMGDKPCTIWANDGKGKFSQLPSNLPPTTAVALGDLDGDGKADLVTAENTVVHIWFNDGRGAFTKGPQELATPESAALALGDLDGDGDLDLFVANWSGKPDQVFLNDGHGTFADSGQKLGKASGAWVSLGDVDGDGDLDAVVANNGEEETNTTEVWLNDGKGRFKNSGQSLGPSNAYSVALGDLDGDGDLDAFVANSNHNGANPPDRVWLNDGKGKFTDSGQSLGNLYSMSLVLADFDNDSDLDAFAGSWKAPPRFWMNDGKGAFTDSNLRLDSLNNQGAVAADFDGDGRQDVFVVTNTWPGGNGHPKLWLNRTGGKK